MKKWTEAAGPYQFPFMGAATRSLKGEMQIQCPKCSGGPLRAYFHMFKPADETGTIWVWCPECRTTTHLPRVTPQVELGPDPFANLTIDEFEALERSEESLLDRLDRMWAEGKLKSAPDR